MTTDPRLDDDTRPERRLAAAMIEQAAKDARLAECRERHAAQDWLDSDLTGWSRQTGLTFRSCADLLGMDYRLLRRRIRSADIPRIALSRSGYSTQRRTS